MWGREIGMSIESGIQKRDRHITARESFVNVHSQRSGQDKIVLRKDGRMRFDLPLRPTEEFKATTASFGGVDRRRVRLNNRSQILLKFCERNEFVPYKPFADRANG